MTRPLIDADVLRYEVGSVGEGDDGVPRSFDYVAEVLDGRIREICAAVKATEAPTLYLTGKGNFREEVAVTKPYKGNRKGEKPYHFKHLTDYMFNQYDTIMVEGMEADDAMCIEQGKHLAYRSDSGENYMYWEEECKTVICTRDKDLRMMPGWHYGWECGAQREFPLTFVDDIGYLELDESKKTPKLKGVGEIFFWAQMLTGDGVDNIPGCPGIGPKKAYLALAGATPDEWRPIVEDLYQQKRCSHEMFVEQAQLLWMVRELNPDGSPKIWHP